MKTRTGLMCMVVLLCLALVPVLDSKVTAASGLYAGCQCTDWARQKRPDIPGGFGPAKDWGWKARNAGFATGSAPAVGAVVVFQPGAQGANATAGHVAYVEAVYSSTSFRVSEMNWEGNPCTVHTRTASTGGGVEFIYYYRNAWRGEYYNNQGLSGSPSFVRSDGGVAFNWGSGNPGGGVGSDHFSVRWTGRFSFDGAEYTFTATTDDGMRVWIDNDLIINTWRDQPATEHRVSRRISGGDHNLKVEYYENGGEAVARLRWERQQRGCGSGAGVYLYEHGNHDGRCQKFTADSPNPRSWNIGNDAASSIRIVGSWTATVCEHDDYHGTCSTFCSTDSDFGNNAIGHDRASSIRVRRGSHCTGSNDDGVYLCEHDDYVGLCQKFTADSPNPRSWSIGNDTASSVRIVGNWTVTICEHDDYQGACSTYTRSDPHIADEAIGNDRASSIRVHR